MWDSTTSYNSWTNTGNGSFTGGEIGMTSEQFTSFFNFLSGGGSGSYTYWTNAPGRDMGGYNSSGMSVGMYGVDAHKITIKDNGWWSDMLDKAADFMNSFSNTQTYGESREMMLYNLSTGDKASLVESVSTTHGEASGLINMDLTFNNREFDGISLSHALGTSLSIKTDGTKEIGQTIGDYELHIGSGPGIGLGQYNVGYKHNSGQNSLGRDLVVRPGFGSFAAVGIIVGTIFAPEITIPMIPVILK